MSLHYLVLFSIALCVRSISSECEWLCDQSLQEATAMTKETVDFPRLIPTSPSPSFACGSEMWRSSALKFLEFLGLGMNETSLDCNSSIDPYMLHGFLNSFPIKTSGANCTLVSQTYIEKNNNVSYPKSITYEDFLLY